MKEKQRPTYDEVGKYTARLNKDCESIVQNFAYLKGFSANHETIMAFNCYLSRKKLTQIADYAQGGK